MQTVPMENQPFFRAYALTFWNYITIALYTVVSVIILYYYAFAEQPQQNYIFFYVTGTQMFLYFAQYRAVRNLYMYLFWLLVALLHLITALSIKNNPMFMFARGHLWVMMANMLTLTLLIQGLRYLSLETQGMELVAPGRSNTDLYDNRKTTVIDFVCFVIYMGVLSTGLLCMK